MAATVTKKLPQVRDVRRQVALFDGRIGPDDTQQLVLRYELAGTLDEREQDVQFLWIELDGPISAQQLAFSASRWNAPKS